MTGLLFGWPGRFAGPQRLNKNVSQKDLERKRRDSTEKDRSGEKKSQDAQAKKDQGVVREAEKKGDDLPQRKGDDLKCPLEQLEKVYSAGASNPRKEIQNSRKERGKEIGDEREEEKKGNDLRAKTYVGAGEGSTSHTDVGDDRSIRAPSQSDPSRRLKKQRLIPKGSVPTAHILPSTRGIVQTSHESKSTSISVRVAGTDDCVAATEAWSTFIKPTKPHREKTPRRNQNEQAHHQRSRKEDSQVKKVAYEQQLEQAHLDVVQQQQLPEKEHKEVVQAKNELHQRQLQDQGEAYERQTLEQKSQYQQCEEVIQNHQLRLAEQQKQHAEDVTNQQQEIEHLKDQEKIHEQHLDERREQQVQSEQYQHAEDVTNQQQEIEHLKDQENIHEQHLDERREQQVQSEQYQHAEDVTNQQQEIEHLKDQEKLHEQHLDERREQQVQFEQHQLLEKDHKELVQEMPEKEHNEVVQQQQLPEKEHNELVQQQRLPEKEHKEVVQEMHELHERQLRDQREAYERQMLEQKSQYEQCQGVIRNYQLRLAEQQKQHAEDVTNQQQEIERLKKDQETQMAMHERHLEERRQQQIQVEEKLSPMDSKGSASQAEGEHMKSAMESRGIADQAQISALRSKLMHFKVSSEALTQEFDRGAAATAARDFSTSISNAILASATACMERELLRAELQFVESVAEVKVAHLEKQKERLLNEVNELHKEQVHFRKQAKDQASQRAQKEVFTEATEIESQHWKQIRELEDDRAFLRKQVDSLLEAHVSTADAARGSQAELKKYILDMQDERQYLRRRLAETSGEIRGYMTSEREKLERQCMESEELRMRLAQVLDPQEVDEQGLMRERSCMQVEDIQSMVVETSTKQQEVHKHEMGMQHTEEQRTSCQTEAHSAVASVWAKVFDADATGCISKLQDKCKSQEQQLHLLRQELLEAKNLNARVAQESSENEEVAQELARTKQVSKLQERSNNEELPQKFFEELLRTQKANAELLKMQKESHKEEAEQELARTRQLLKQAEDQVRRLQCDLRAAQTEKHQFQVLGMQPVCHDGSQKQSSSADPSQLPQFPSGPDSKDFKSFMRQSLKDLIKGRHLTIIQEGGACKPCILKCSKDLLSITVSIVETGSSKKSEVYNIPLMDVQQIVAGNDDHFLTSTSGDQKTAKILFGRGEYSHAFAFCFETIQERDQFVNSLKVIRLATMQPESVDYSISSSAPSSFPPSPRAQLL